MVDKKLILPLRIVSCATSTYSYTEHSTHLVCGKPHKYIFELFLERAGLKIWK